MEYNIYDVVLDARLRKRPGMFIGDVSPNNLHVFLRGYQNAMEDAGVVDVSAPSFHEFHDWIAGKFGFSNSTAGWHRMILAMTLMLEPENVDWESYDRNVTRQQLTEATRRCFDLIEEFRGASTC